MSYARDTIDTLCTALYEAIDRQSLAEVNRELDAQCVALCEQSEVVADVELEEAFAVRDVNDYWDVW